jgi:hypothetical protein
MLYKTMTCALIAAVAANNAEVSTSNLRNGASFDNLKASWGKRFSVGDFDSQLDASYDYNANRDFLKDVKLSGNLLDGNGDDLRVGYEVTKNFDGGKSTELKLTAEMSGTKVCADLNSDDQLKEVSAQRSVAIGDRNVDVEPSFLVKAQVDMAMGGENAPTYELGYERDLEDGRQVSATLQPANKNVDIELVDNKFEQGAVWTAKASVPLEGDAKGVLDAAKVSLKRAWTW